MEKVIYIPGFTGGRRDIQGLKKALGNFQLIYFDYDTGLKEPLERTAGKLEEFIEDIKWDNGEKGAIIGVSAGGIIADYYLKFLKNGRIDKFISLCSPFRGTYLAAIPSRREGLVELRRNSPFLRELAEKELKDVEVENIWSPFDIVVIPGSSAQGTNPKISYCPIHPLAQFWPSTIKEVKRFLEYGN